MREHCTGRALKACTARLYVGSCMACACACARSGVRVAWSGRGGEMHAERAHSSPGAPAVSRNTQLRARLLALNATNGYSLSRPTRPCLRARASRRALDERRAGCVVLCVLVSWYSWRCLSCGLGASCVGAWHTTHPPEHVHASVLARAWGGWHRRGEALSPASLPSVGDRVRYCYDCSYFVRRYSAYVSGLIRVGATEMCNGDRTIVCRRRV